MVRRFFTSVNTDDRRGPVSNDIAQVDWDNHLPKLTAFWARALLDIDGCHGKPGARHAHLHRTSPLTPTHFERLHRNGPSRFVTPFIWARLSM